MTPTAYYRCNRRIRWKSWTSSNPLNTARWIIAGAGTQTAALAFGGNVPPALQEQQKNMME
jgi:hypothetical protein